MRERYGAWTGNPKGTPGNHELCSESVSPSTGWNSYQCSRKGIIEENGELWCKQHAPANVKAKREKVRAEWKAKSEARIANQPANVRRAAIEECLAVVEAIETGSVTAGNRTCADAIRALLGGEA